MIKKRKILFMLIFFLYALMLGTIISYGNNISIDSYEKEVISVYSLDGGEIPMEIQYSEYNSKLGATYQGTLSLIDGEMKDGFTFYMTYKGSLNKK